MDSKTDGDPGTGARRPYAWNKRGYRENMGRSVNHDIDWESYAKVAEACRKRGYDIQMYNLADVLGVDINLPREDIHNAIRESCFYVESSQRP